MIPPASSRAVSAAETRGPAPPPSSALTVGAPRLTVPFRLGRCLALGLALIPLNAFWLVRMEVAGMIGSSGGASGPYPTTFSLYANAVVWLLILVGANRVATRRAPRWALSQPELLVVYVMLVVASSIHSLDLMDVLVPMLGHPTWFATTENRWAERVLPHIPDWWRVQSKEALIGYYHGNASLYRWEILRAWAPPVLVWGAFLLVLVGTMLCLSSLVRRRWVEEERLAYPIVQLPMSLSDPGGRLLADRLLWIGAACSGGIGIWNGFAKWYPSLPEVSVRIQDMAPYFTTPPWNAIGWTPISFYPFAIGMAYLLPVDLLFSCWFFYLFWKAERITGAALGLAEPGSRYPYVNEQCLGAYVALVLAALWTGRATLFRLGGSKGKFSPPASLEAQREAGNENAKTVSMYNLWARSVGRWVPALTPQPPLPILGEGEQNLAGPNLPSPRIGRGAGGEGRPSRPSGSTPEPFSRSPSDEAIPPLVALLGASLGTVALAGFFVAVGLHPGLAVGGIALYLVVSLSVTRMRAELGPPAHDLHFIGPEQVFATIYGTRALAGRALVLLSYFFWFNRAYRGHPMPNQLEAFKMAERTAISPRTFVLPIALATVMGVICGFWTYLHFAYQLGGSARMPGHVVWFGREPFDRLSGWLATPGPPDQTALWAIATGGGMALALQVLKLRFTAWPLHPLGFAVSGSWSMNTIWIPVMIAWAAKAITLRYAGLRGYRTLLPFFFGLTLGDFTIGCLWPLVGWLFGVPYYSFQQ